MGQTAGFAADHGLSDRLLDQLTGRIFKIVIRLYLSEKQTTAMKFRNPQLDHIFPFYNARFHEVS
jgi:hypothetical protein